MKNFSLIHLYLTIFLLGINTASGKQACDDTFNKSDQVEIKRDNYETLIKIWESASNDCKNNSLYSRKLSNLYSMNKNYEKAENIVDKALKIFGDKDPGLELAKASIYSRRWAQTTRSDKDLKMAETSFENIIKKHPNYDYGFSAYATLLLMAERYPEAIEKSNKALNLNDKHYISYRTLIIAFSAEKKYKLSTRAFENALALDKNSLFSDKDAMVFVALAYAELGKLETSLGVLNKLIEHSPESKKDPSFQKVTRRLIALIKKS